MTEQPEALFLADELEAPLGTVISGQVDKRAAAELRRLYEVNAELLALLKEVCDETRHPDYDWSVDLAQRVSAAIAKAEQKTHRAALNFVHRALQDEARASVSYVESDAETYGFEEQKP